MNIGRLIFPCEIGVILMIVVCMRADAGLQLGLDGPVDLGGIEFGDEEDERVLAIDVDPTTGHLWVIGRVSDSGELFERFGPFDMFEVDTSRGEVISAFLLESVGEASDYPILRHPPGSLAIDPLSGNLTMPWNKLVDEGPNFSGILQVTQQGDLISFYELSQTGAVRGNVAWDFGILVPPGETTTNEFHFSVATFDTAGSLYFGGGNVIRVNPQTRTAVDLAPLTDPNSDMKFRGLAGDIHPQSGNLFVLARCTSACTDDPSRPDVLLLEADPSTAEIVSLTNITDFLPPSSETIRARAMAFDVEGDTIFVGGLFGVVALRVVPEPTSILFSLMAATFCVVLVRRSGMRDGLV